MNKENIKIASISDIHGFLIQKDVLIPSDVLTISGDIFPLHIQRDIDACEKWLLNEFSTWIDEIPFDKVIMIAGNHDFYFAKKHALPQGVSDKLIYLEDSSCEYEGITFYGCPWCVGPFGWAFCPNMDMLSVSCYYSRIPKCDILLVHQPPKIGTIGTTITRYSSNDYSSDELLQSIYKKEIIAVFCGHVHTGNHEEILYPTSGCDTKFYNVSILNEQYKWFSPPRYTIYNTKTRSINII